MAVFTCRRHGPPSPARRSAQFATMPYAEIAKAVLAPFTGDEIAAADLSRMIDEAYATFRHPAVTPAGADRPQRLHPRTFPRPDARLQGRGDAAAGAADGPCAGRARRARDHRRRDLRRYRRGGDRGLCRAASAPTSSSCFRKGRVSPVQQRQMTTSTAANVHALAIEGNFDDCQALVKAMFNDHAFRDRVKLSGVNSINWAPDHGPDRLLFLVGARRSAHRTGRSPSPCRPAISAISLPATPPSAWACRSNGWSSPPTTTTFWRARSRPARYEMRGVIGDDLAVDGHPDLLQFRAAAVRGVGPRRGAVTPADGRPQAIRRASPSTARRSCDNPRRVRRRRGQRWPKPPPTIAATCSRTAGYLLDPHTAVGIHVAAHQPRAGSADGRACHRPSGEVPRCGRSAPAASIRRFRHGSRT